MENKKNSLLGSFIQKLKSDKKLEVTVYIVLAALALIIYISSLGIGKTEKNAQTIQSPQTEKVVALTEEEVEKRLEQTLSKIRGAGKVSVMVTFDTSGEMVPAINSKTEDESSQGDSQNSESRSVSNEPATINSEDEEIPIVIKEINPTVRGVIVIAEGAADITVKINLERAVEAVLGINSSCIEVFEMTSVNTNN